MLGLRGYNTFMQKTETPDEVFNWPVRVYYEDTDAGGVVYHANYLKFCERARTEFLRQRGLDQSELRAREGLVFVVARIEADYLRGAELDDELLVQSRVETLGQARAVFDQVILAVNGVFFPLGMVASWLALRPVLRGLRLVRQGDRSVPGAPPRRRHVRRPGCTPWASMC